MFARDFAERKMLAYVAGIQREERKHKVETLTHQKWSGAEFVDAALQAVTSGLSSTAAMGHGNTGMSPSFPFPLTLHFLI
jgi:isocitrate lyase